MDSFPTGSMQSWLIVTTVALSPIIILFLADTIGRVHRQAKGKGVEQARRGRKRDRPVSNVRNRAVVSHSPYRPPAECAVASFIERRKRGGRGGPIAAAVRCLPVEGGPFGGE